MCRAQKKPHSCSCPCHCCCCSFHCLSLCAFTVYLHVSVGTYTGWGTALQAWWSQVRLSKVSLLFFIDVTLPSALWPWIDSTSNKNEYQECFVGGKGGRCLGLTTLTPSSADCFEIWSLILLEPPGPVMCL
jgi:hypothetical protein